MLVWPPFTSVSRFGWVGRLGYYRQPDTADYWLRARVHRPQIGRFLSRDPVRKANLYTWPGNSPVVLVDPSGMTELWPHYVRVRCQDFATSNLCCSAVKPTSVTGLWTARARCTCGNADDPCRVDFYSTPCDAAQPKLIATAKGIKCVEANPPQFYCIGCETQPAKPERIALWAGDLVSDLQPEHNCTAVLDALLSARAELLRAGYDVPPLGRTWAELREFNRLDHMVGLFADAHGRCDPGSPPDSCQMADFTDTRRYRITRPGQGDNDWLSLDRTTRPVLRRFRVYHCLAEARPSDIPLITDWFQMRLVLLNREAIGLCPVDKQGYCYVDQMLSAIRAFTRAFVAEAES